MDFIWYFVILVVLATIFFLVWHRPKKRPKYPYSPRTKNKDVEDFMFFLNLLRDNDGLGWVKADEHASMMEHVHAMEMAKNGVSHNGLDDRRSDIASKGATHIGEIVDGGFYSVKTAFDGFVNSPSHKKAMMDPNVNTCGVGIAQDSKKKYYIACILFRA